MPLNQHKLWRPGFELTSWSELKFIQAGLHARELKSRIELWLVSIPYRASQTISDDRKTVSIAIHTVTPPPLHEFSLTLGNCLHNARGALEAVAWEVAQLNGVDENNRQVQFPMCQDAKKWDDALKGKFFPAEFLERIKPTQPFNFEERNSSALALLSALNNQDKHKSAIEFSYDLESVSVDGSSIEFEEKFSGDPSKFSYSVEKNGEGRVRISIKFPARVKSAHLPLDALPRFLIRHDSVAIEANDGVDLILSEVRKTLDLIHGD